MQNKYVRIKCILILLKKCIQAFRYLASLGSGNDSKVLSIESPKLGAILGVFLE